MLRAGSDNCGRGTVVSGIRRSSDIHVEKRIRAAQPPEILGPPFRRDLQSLGVAEQSVAELRRQQQMNGRRNRFEKRPPRQILAEKIVIVVIESSRVEVQVLAQQPPISDLVSVELFGSEVGVGVESRKVRRTVGRRGDVSQKIEI